MVPVRLLDKNPATRNAIEEAFELCCFCADEVIYDVALRHVLKGRFNLRWHG